MSEPISSPAPQPVVWDSTKRNLPQQLCTEAVGADVREGTPSCVPCQACRARDPRGMFSTLREAHCHSPASPPLSYSFRGLIETVRSRAGVRFSLRCHHPRLLLLGNQEQVVRHPLAFGMENTGPFPPSPEGDGRSADPESRAEILCLSLPNSRPPIPRSIPGPWPALHALKTILEQLLADAGACWVSAQRHPILTLTSRGQGSLPS